MSYRYGASGRIEVHGALPSGWRRTLTDGGPTEVLAIDGPDWLGARRPSLVVAIESGDEAAMCTHASAGGCREPGRCTVASRERWPHPAWGSGVVAQGVYDADGVAMAHDVFRFHDGRGGIRVDLNCELSALFEVEDDVARIVDALGFKERV